MLTPKYALCPAIHNASCSVGSLPAYQAYELVITDRIGRDANVGEQIGLTIDAQGVAHPPATALSPAVASISTLVGQASASPTPIDTGTFGDGSGLPPGTIPGLPGTTITPSGLASLFPVVTPSPSPVSSQAPSKHKVTRATSTASSLPIDPRLIGGQLAGLAVLVAAITMVVARLSLRTPQLAGAAAGGTGPAKTPESPAPPAPATTTEAQATEPEAKPE